MESNGIRKNVLGDESLIEAQIKMFYLAENPLKAIQSLQISRASETSKEFGQWGRGGLRRFAGSMNFPKNIWIYTLLILHL